MLRTSLNIGDFFVFCHFFQFSFSFFSYFPGCVFVLFFHIYFFCFFNIYFFFSSSTSWLINDFSRLYWGRSENMDLAPRSRMVIWISSKNIRCTTRFKGPHVCQVWWLTVLWFLRFTIPIVCPEKKRIIGIVPKLKTMKDSKVIRNLLITKKKGYHLYAHILF